MVIRTTLAVLFLVGLAYLGGHPRVRAWEERWRVAHVVTAGFPFVLLGLAARHPAVGVVTAPVLAQLGTLFGFALGWIGLVAGFRFDPRLLGGLPPGVAGIVGLATSIPCACVALLTGLALLSISGVPAHLPTLARDALILGTAGAMTAKTGARLLGAAESAGLVSRIARIEELVGVLGLAAVAAYFRPQAGGWQLPGTAWLLLTVGLGAAAGLLMYAMLSTARSRPELVVLTLGSVSFAAGVAGCLRLSPIGVTFLAGALLANFPGVHRAALGAALRRLERPVYLLSLFAIGALWDPSDWRGWVVMPVFMAARLIGKRLGANAAAAWGGLRLGPREREALAVAPMGPLAIAIVVNAHLLYPDLASSLIAPAVVGGGILTEVVVQLVTRGKLSTMEREAGAVGRIAAPRPAASAAGSREAIG
ncbi:hypothetical protein AMPC_32190 [Anaeromyxobacter paludicola]|uniref:Cation/H+ exchanger domain-containing protein n=2 Tax=Anaeromyxobacter paludicola TaxID=2918171 RepID=A0ABM7XE07_9BACT|nr:hypothetical protein AMPC_32190 [Anaeromyxobacter paludicola]